VQFPIIRRLRPIQTVASDPFTKEAQRHRDKFYG
jgi:hypothetical protein